MKEYNGLRELTPGFPQHTYFLNEAGKCVAYIKKGTTEILYNKKPMSFSKSYRKFDKVYIPEYKEQV